MCACKVYILEHHALTCIENTHKQYCVYFGKSTNIESAVSIKM